MSLQQQIKSEMMQALKAKEEIRLLVLRGLISSFTNELVNLKRTPQDTLTDEEALNVIRKAVKQRKDSIEQFEKGGRMDLAQNEKMELSILDAYLPAQMSKEEVMKLALIKKEELNLNDKSKIGMFMGALMKELKGKADGDIVKAVVDEILN